MIASSLLRPVVLLGCLLSSTVVFAQSGVFYEGYYREVEQGDYAGAAELYRRVADDSAVDSTVRERARRRLAGCQEEIASSDFARLMRPETILFVELSRPGAQLKELASKLGLLRDAGTDPAQIGVSAALLDGLLGVRGAAIGVSGFDAMRQVPRGILIAHPGNVDTIRGLIETALPAAARPESAIHGYSTYAIEEKHEDFTVYVTLTERLVLVSPQRTTIEQTILRLRGQGGPTLADVPELKTSLDRRGDGLVYFGLNFQRLLPLVQPLMAMAAQQNPELNMMLATCDLPNLLSVSGNLGVAAEGLTLDLDLEMRQGHRNLVYNFFRMPGVDETTLRAVPPGVAAFVTGSLNERRAAPDSPALDPSVVSFMDIGREVFGNIVGVAAFVTKTEGETIAGEALPGVALAMTVNDAEKTEALWTQLLGVASSAARGSSQIDGVAIDMAGGTALRYDLPEGIPVFLARRGRTFIVSPSRQAIEQSLTSLAGETSVLTDPTFATAIRDVDANSTFAAFGHARRLIELAVPHMHPRELEEIQPLLPLLDDTVASVRVHHSGQHLRLTGLIGGLPRLGPWIGELIRREMGHPAARPLVEGRHR